jgi:uncharacterized protein YukE
MTAQVIAHPEHLRKFAQSLKRSNADLHSIMSKLQGNFKNLGETWRDQEHRKFADQFVQTMRMLDKYIKSADEHIPLLLKKADRLQAYLEARR